MTDAQWTTVDRMTRALVDDMARRGVGVLLSVEGWHLRLDIVVPAGTHPEDDRALVAECYRRVCGVLTAGGVRKPRLLGPVEYVTGE